MSGNMAGLRDWIIQRVTAVFLGLYMMGLAIYCIAHPHLPYDLWKALFTAVWFKVATILALISLCWHAWIGVWTVITDYLHQPVIRIAVQLVVIFLLIVYFIWGIQVLWSIPQ